MFACITLWLSELGLTSFTISTSEMFDLCYAPFVTLVLVSSMRLILFSFILFNYWFYPFYYSFLPEDLGCAIKELMH